MGSKHLPWLDGRGNLLNNEELKTVSKNWDQHTWEGFLDCQDGTCSESMISPNRYDRIAENLECSIFDPAADENETSLTPDVSFLMRLLTRRQRKVIQMIFWHNLTEREIARRLKISRVSVQVLKRRSLEKLKSFSTQAFDLHRKKPETVIHAPYYVGASDSRSLQRRKKCSGSAGIGCGQESQN